MKIKPLAKQGGERIHVMIIGLVIPWWHIAVRVVTPLINWASGKETTAKKTVILKREVEVKYIEQETYPAAPVTMAFFP